jgi:hypothetical protein
MLHEFAYATASTILYILEAVGCLTTSVDHVLIATKQPTRAREPKEQGKTQYQDFVNSQRAILVEWMGTDMRQNSHSKVPHGDIMGVLE